MCQFIPHRYIPDEYRPKHKKSKGGHSKGKGGRRSELSTFALSTLPDGGEGATEDMVSDICVCVCVCVCSPRVHTDQQAMTQRKHDACMLMWYLFVHVYTQVEQLWLSTVRDKKLFHIVQLIEVGVTVTVCVCACARECVCVFCALWV